MTLTEMEAFKAMRVFIQNYSLRKGNPIELTLLLTDIELLRGETPIDPAMWPDWLDAIEKVKKLNNTP